MRDVLLALILLPCIPAALKFPFVGAMAYAWVSLMNPHRSTWGFAYDMPWAQMLAIATMVGLLLSEPKLIGDSLKRYWLPLLYLAWMTVTTLFALEPRDAQVRYNEVLKTHVMCFVTLALLSDRRRVMAFAALITLSVAFYGIKGGFFTIVTGGNFLVWGPLHSAIYDNNALAAGLVVVLPMVYWLYALAPGVWLKLAGLGSFVLIVASIFGSSSRGAFLALVIMSGVFFLKAKHKFMVLILGAFGVMFGLMMMPEKYWERIQTIQTFQEDASAMGRINTWTTAWRIANDRVVGAGFEYYGAKVFQRYAPNPDGIHSAHSIYFQALGEHGWIGLILYAGILLTFWMRSRSLIRSFPPGQRAGSEALLARMLQVSLIGFMVGGAFVNIGNWDFFFYLFVLSAAMIRLRGAEVAEPVEARPSFTRGRMASAMTPASRGPST